MKKVLVLLGLFIILLSATYILNPFGIKYILNSFEHINIDKSKTPKIILIKQLNNKIKESRLTTATNLLQKYFNCEVVVDDEVIQIPKECFNGRRYRAEKVLDFLKDIKPDTVFRIIGVTNNDISTTRYLNGKTYDDYGILGLASLISSEGLISDYRTSSKGSGKDVNFAKTFLHEFMHTLNVDHCKHEYCFMQDGNGSGKNMRESNHLHKECLDKANKTLVKIGN